MTLNSGSYDLIGVVSFGNTETVVSPFGNIEKCLIDYPSVFARVSKQLAWIEETTRTTWNTCGRYAIQYTQSRSMRYHDLF